MARSLPSNRTANRARPAAVPVTPRTLILAGIGAALLARREAERLAAEASSVPQRLRAGADAAVETACIEAKKLANSARTGIAPLRREVAKLGTQLEAAREQGLAEAAKRLNPLLARVGLPTLAVRRPAAKRGVRKPAASRRPAAKKAVKAVRRRA